MNDVSNFVQAIRGPVMLIALGSLVAIDYAGIYGFWRTWPILIIVFGVLKLLERATAKPGPPPPYGYPGQYPGGQTGDRPPGGNAI
ncbi:MAG TPA: hypothetical protein VK686_06560 [Bryobacteraceae bacterium]|jgi:hypothetical protein|nr:hypothetical protein [Bryobacteraceae bacterium]